MSPFHRGSCALSLMLLACSVCPAQDRDAELGRHREKLRQKWEIQFRAADASADRLLSRDEVRAAKLPESLVTRFDEIDADDDDRLSPEELWAMYERRLQAQRRPSGPPR